MLYELKSIGVWSYIKVMFFINLFVGFGLGIFYGIFSGLFLALASELMFIPEDIMEMADGFPIGIYVIFMGFMFSIGNAVFGTVFGVIVIGFYNMIVKMVGGLELNLNLVSAESIAQPIAAQTNLGQMAPVEGKVRPTIPPPPPPVPETPAPPPAPPLTTTPPEPPETKPEEKKEQDKFKPPDYLENG